MRSALIIAAMMILSFTSTVYGAQGLLLERTFSGVSKAANPESAKRDVQDQAAKKVSEDIIKELIGEAKFLKNKTLIQNKIIKSSSRYIPFFKPSDVIPEGETFKVSVELKVSLNDLKQLLQVNSLLNENDAIPVVLPVISWKDRVQSRSYSWWIPTEGQKQGFLVKEGRLLEQALRNSFQRSNFFLMRPIEENLGLSVPADFQNEKVSGGEDAQFFAQYFNAPLLIDGQVVINKGERNNNYRIEIRLAALQVSNGRAIADVSRRFDTDSGAMESMVDKKLREVLESTANDLAAQVLEAWQRGSVGTSVIRLSIKGRNTLPVIESVKEKIRTQLTQVKNIRERLIGSNSVSFEVDTSVAPSELLSKLAALDFDGKKLVKISEASDEIVLQWAQ